MNKKKHIIFIPPNGIFKIQDFSIHRISCFLSKLNLFELTLLYIDVQLVSNPTDSHIKENFNNIIVVKTQEELFKYLNNSSYDYIFNRAWMHSYYFAYELSKSYKNVIINIKDWNFAPENIYNFLFNNKDYEGIKNLFLNNTKILSHFTFEQIELWSKQYNINLNNFIFFPEYCNTENYVIRENISYSNNECKLVLAGSLQPTVYPQDYFPGKDLLNSVRKLTKNNIKIDFVIPASVYDLSFGDKLNLFYDLDFERNFNNNFNIVRGEILNPILLKEYHFGFFELESNCINTEVIKYAIVSKFAFYLEAHIPLLVNKSFKSIAKIVQDNSLGIVFENDDIANFNILLDITQEQYNCYLKNILEFRKKFTYNIDLIKNIFL